MVPNIGTDHRYIDTGLSKYLWTDEGCDGSDVSQIRSRKISSNSERL